MQFWQAIKDLLGRQPIDQLPLDWNSLGYSTDSFNRDAGDPDFPGWPGDVSDEEEASAIWRLLGGSPGDRLLDVACGYGRHAFLLARKGARVTGVDSSPGVIQNARRRAESQGPAVEFLRQDARALAWEGNFDLAVIAFNSFGLFSPEDAPAVLRGIGRALKPGGRLFMDLPHGREGGRYPRRAADWRVERGALVLQEVSFRRNPLVEVCRDIWLKPGAERLEEFIVHLRLYNRPEITALLGDCGFEVRDMRGGWDLGPMGPDTRKILLVAAKA